MVKYYIIGVVVFLLWLGGWIYVLKTYGIKEIIKALTEPDFFIYF